MKLLIEEADPRTQLEDAARLLASEHPLISDRAAEYVSWYYTYAADETCSWLLRTDNGELKGLCSILPRTIRYGDRSLRAGVIGNLVVARESRNGYGAIEMLRAVQAQVRSGRFDVLLGRPNQKAVVLARWLGFRQISSWDILTSVRRSRAPLCRRLGLGGAALAPLFDSYAALRRRVRRRSRVRLKFKRLEPSQCRRVCPNGWGFPAGHFVSDQDFAYVCGRFLDSPIHAYQVWGIETPSATEICGFLVVTLEEGKLHICDCRVDARFCSLGDAIAGFCESDAIDADLHQVKTPDGSSLSDALRSAGFMRARGSRSELRDHMMGYWLDENPLADDFAQPEKWSILIGFDDV